MAGDEVETKLGDDVRAAKKEIYAKLIDEVEPMEGARDLLAFLSRRGHKVVLASSAKQEELDHYLDMLEAHGIADAWTSSGGILRK